jgi:hypothetical protein
MRARCTLAHRILAYSKLEYRSTKVYLPLWHRRPIQR